MRIGWLAASSARRIASRIDLPLNEQLIVEYYSR